jgi:hypothetical protein
MSSTSGSPITWKDSCLPLGDYYEPSRNCNYFPVLPASQRVQALQVIMTGNVGCTEEKKKKIVPDEIYCLDEVKNLKRSPVPCFHSSEDPHRWYNKHCWDSHLSKNITCQDQIRKLWDVRNAGLSKPSKKYSHSSSSSSWSSSSSSTSDDGEVLQDTTSKTMLRKRKDTKRMLKAFGPRNLISTLGQHRNSQPTQGHRVPEDCAGWPSVEYVVGRDLKKTLFLPSDVMGYSSLYDMSKVQTSCKATPESLMWVKSKPTFSEILQRSLSSQRNTFKFNRDEKTGDFVVIGLDVPQPTPNPTQYQQQQQQLLLQLPKDIKLTKLMPVCIIEALPVPHYVPVIGETWLKNSIHASSFQ